VDVSWQPQKSPGDSQVEDREVAELGTVVDESRQPSQPGSWQVVLDVGVMVGTTVGEGVALVVVVVVVVGSLHPNQPGVLHVVVVAVGELVVVLVVVVVVVVVSSKHPHQPGVSQVDVLVLDVDVVEVDVVVVVISEPLLRKNFQSSQS
jgi:hypothetical protein